MSTPDHPGGCDGCLRLAVLALAFAVLVLVIAFACRTQLRAQVALSGPVAKVIDGDTLEVQGQRVRLHGIDAPEVSQTCRRGSSVYHCGAVSLVRLEELIDGRPVTCTLTGAKSYGRLIARCFVATDDPLIIENIDLGGWLVRNGYAVAYTRYSRDYLPQEGMARAARLGIWAGAFVQPWEWRKGKR